MSGLCDRIRELLGRHYPGRADFDAVAPLGKRACRLSYPDGVMVFKHHADWVADRVPLQVEIVSAVAESGLGAAVEPGDSGPVIMEGRDVFSLQRHLEGVLPGQGDAEVVAKGLGRLHALLAGINHRDTPHHIHSATQGLLARAEGYGFREEVSVAARATGVLARDTAQLVHGDPHPANMVMCGGKAFFIDFDSAHLGSSVQEVAFAAFRLLGPDREGVNGFIHAYLKERPDRKLAADEIGPLAVHAVMSRLVFILSERDRGETCWMDDLDNQRRYLAQALDLARG